MENPIKMDDLGENPLFSETSISSSSPSPRKVFLVTPRFSTKPAVISSTNTAGHTHLEVFLTTQFSTTLADFKLGMESLQGSG